MTEGLFRARQRLDDKNDASVDLLKKRKSSRNECEAG
jgi:hypothetical protein